MGCQALIHFTDSRRRYKKEAKKREIYYSCHADRRIYQYYSYMLNQAYSTRAGKDGINECVIAYRDNLAHRNNVHFARQAFDFIQTTDKAYIIIGDFHKFFDSLDHRYLKTRMKDLLGVPSLTKDWYAIFKNLTQYSYVELEWLFEKNGLSDSSNRIKKLNALKTVLPIGELRRNHEHIKQPAEKVGIPQGTAISAVLANVYMLQADKQLQDFVARHKGLYMRYSDDFIIVLPERALTGDFERCMSRMMSIINEVPNLILQPEKTQQFYFSDQKIYDLKGDGSIPTRLDYLGFTFDGMHVKLRDKTTSKYYYRMRRKARSIVRQRNDGRRAGTKNLYMLYSSHGEHKSPGNFLTYLKRAEEVFPDQEISQIRKRHKYKIKRMLKKPI